MRTIELLSDHIEEELDDAYTYAKLALEYKETDPETAKLFYTLSGEEMNHMDLLHKRVVSCIESYKREHGEPSEGMKALYDFAHKRQIKRAEGITVLQEMFKR